jgi:hypothetical protein
MRQGRGIWRGNNNESYDGEWRRGKAHGFGIHVWSNGDKYDGEWYRSLKHGKGKDIFHTGDTYEGEYRYGKFDGTGVFNWSKGMIYKGQFKEGMRQGKGQWLENEDGSGANYNGEYFRDKKHGIGVYKWPSGNEYRGNYINDKREGYGEMYWTDGSIYKGEWKEGIQNGNGKITFVDGVVKEGQFVNNMYVDSKTYQYTIDPEENNQLLHKSVYSHMPRTSFTAMDEREKDYLDNQATQKRKYSIDDHPKLKNHSQTFPRGNNAYHSPEQNSGKYNIEMANDERNTNMAFTAPYKKRQRSRFNSNSYNDKGNEMMFPNINSNKQLHKHHESYDLGRAGRAENPHNYYTSGADDYDSEYMGPRKPYLREDRSTSPPDHDPLFRKAHQRSIGIQEVDSQELIQQEKPKKHKSVSKKKISPQKIKFSKNFVKKYPSLFKGINTKKIKSGKQGKMMTVIYKPWVPSSRKYTYFGDIGNKYKVY